jgi:hypothetical protein
MYLSSSGLRLHFSSEHLNTKSRVVHIYDLVAEGLVTFNVACLSNIIVLSVRAVMYRPTHILSRADIADLGIRRRSLDRTSPWFSQRDSANIYSISVIIRRSD